MAKPIPLVQVRRIDGIDRFDPSHEFAGLGDAAGHHRVGLIDVVTAALEHRRELWQALIVELAAGDRQLRSSTQRRQIGVSIECQRLFDPGIVELGRGHTKLDGTIEAPARRVGDDGHPPALVGVHAQLHVVAHPCADLANVGDVLRERVGVDTQLDRREALRETSLHLFGARGCGAQLASRCIEAHRTGFAAKQRVNRRAAGLADQIPAGRLNPSAAPAQIAHFPNALLNCR